MATQLIPRVDLDVAAGEKEHEPVARSADDEGSAQGGESLPEAEHGGAARAHRFDRHAHEYEPPFSR